MVIELVQIVQSLGSFSRSRPFKPFKFERAIQAGRPYKESDAIT